MRQSHDGDGFDRPGKWFVVRLTVIASVAVVQLRLRSSKWAICRWTIRSVSTRRTARRWYGGTVATYGARVLLLALVPSALVARSAEGHKSAAPRGDPAGGGFLGRAHQEAQQWQTWIRSPGAAAKRRASRSAYHRQTAAKAAATDDSAFSGMLTTPGYQSLGERTARRTQKSATILHQLGADEAIVKGPNGRASLARSALPIEGKAPDGHSAPVDLNLVAHDGSFAERSALVPVTIPRSSGGAIEFTHDHFGINFGSGAAVFGQRRSGSVFYPNLERDTDVVLRPAPLGAEITYLLRSAVSPESQTLTFDLPSGWSLHDPGNHNGTVQVLSDTGKIVNEILPPLAADAQGRPVPVRYEIKNARQLILEVRHRTGDFAYPIMVDPVSVDYSADGPYNWWTATSDNINKFSAYHASGSGGYSMWKMHASTSYSQDEYAAWELPAPSGAYIYALHESGVYHHPYKSAEFGGLWKPDNSGPDPAGTWSQTNVASGSGSGYFSNASLSNSDWWYCVRQGCAYGPSQNIPNGNHAEFGLLANSSGAQPSSNGAYDYVSDATVYYADNVTPSLSAPTHNGYQPGSWTQNATDTVSVTGSVASGLGMYQLSLSGASAPSVTVDCTNLKGAAQVYCSPKSLSGTFTYSTSSLPEGSNTVALTATNAGGNSTSQSWPVNIDRTPPVVSISGSAYDAQTQQSTSGSGSLTVSASDAAPDHATSGVVSISTYVDGQVVTGAPTASQACTQGGCSLSANGQIDFDSLSPGGHTIEVRVLDAAGNVGESDWAVVVGSGTQVYRSVDDCWTGGTSLTMPRPTMVDLGSTFDSLSLSDVAVGCNPDPSAVAAANTDDVANSVPYISTSFGSCQVDPLQQEGGCAPPLTVQYWPRCARNEESYSVPSTVDGSDQLMANTDVALDQLTSPIYSQVLQALSQESWLLPPSLTPGTSFELSQIPSASYEGGTRIEIYAGATTIVVFADDTNLANLAASALALRIATNGLQGSASTMDANALGEGCYS